MLTEIADGVLVHTSEFIQSNAVAVRGRAGALLIDAGITGDEMATIANDLRDRGQPVVAGFSTHAHWDHLLWHARFGDAPRYGTARSAADIGVFLSNADWRDDITGSLPPGVEVPLHLFGLISGLPADSAQIPWDGPRVRVIEHAAHAAGHASLLIEERRVLIAGDMLSDVLVPMLNLRSVDPIDEYLAALSLLESVVQHVDSFVPGHGSGGGAGELITRIDLDRAYVTALRGGRAVDDPRIGSSAQPGWEWVGDVHAGQVKGLAQRGAAAQEP